MNDRPADEPAPQPLRPATEQPSLNAELNETLPGNGQPLHPVLADLANPRTPAADEEFEDDGPPERWILLPVTLFLATCLSTFWVGASRFMPVEIFGASYNAGGLIIVRQSILENWQSGLIYMACVLAILLAHEMGHFIATL